MICVSTIHNYMMIYAILHCGLTCFYIPANYVIEEFQCAPFWAKIQTHITSLSFLFLQAVSILPSEP